MKEENAVSHRLRLWIDQGLSSLSPINPLHIHADELFGDDLVGRKDSLEPLKTVYLEAIDVLGGRLSHVMPVLTIPLVSVDCLDSHPPDLDQLDFGEETPSIYLIHRDASKYLGKYELYRRFLNDFTLFDDRVADVFFFYEVFRREQERRFGWEYTRTIKGEHYLPDQRVD